MPDMVKTDTRIEAKMLEVDRRLYLRSATLKYLRPVAAGGFDTTATRTRHWFLKYGEETSEDVTVIFMDADLDNTLGAALEGVEFVEMLDVKYKVTGVDRPKPTGARVYFIHTTIKKFIKRSFRIP